MRICIVSTVDITARTVRVTDPTRDDAVSGDLRVMPFAVQPVVGDNVVCLFADGTMSDGVCLGVMDE